MLSMAERTATLTNGLDSRDNYYMKRVYLACVRGIDFPDFPAGVGWQNAVAQEVVREAPGVNP